MKRQRGRNRGGGGNKPQQHNANRAFDSNGPEGVKVRGAAQSVFEKYQQLARDAAQGGDRVLAENHLQHAEHYFRVLRAMQPARPVTDFIGRDQFSSGFDIDFEAEPEEVEAVEPEAPAAEGEGEERPRDDRQRDDRQRDDRPRFDRQRDDRQRDDRPRDGQPREDRPRDDRQKDRFEGQGRRDRWRDRDDRPRDGQPRDDRPREEGRDDRPRDDRPPREGREGRRFDRGDRQDRGEARDPLAVVEPQATPLTAEEPAESSPRLRGQDGAVSELPAFLGRSSAPAEEAATEAAPKPRRRRAPRTEGPAETEDA
jgi:hypothetical protein